MHPATESLIQRNPDHTVPHHHPPQEVKNTGKGTKAAVRLKTGFERFKTTIYDKNLKLFEPLKTSQTPKYMVFACSDSRVCPTLTLGLQPGEAFTVRNIAGMVPAYQEKRHCSIGSAIEFAVVVLKVECIVVMGHSRCAGIKELLSLKADRPHAYHFIEDWVKVGMNAKRKVLRENRLLPFDDQCTVLEKLASQPDKTLILAFVNESLANLKSYPFVKDRLRKGTLSLLGARYDFVNVSLETWNP